MSNPYKMIPLEQITETKAYKSLNSVQRTFVRTRANRSIISHGLELLKHKSKDKWLKEHAYSYSNKAIILELHENIKR